MKTFNALHIPYVGPANLEIVSNTYNTLEQGHKDSIQAASALKATISQLDLNDNENEWKQQQLNQVQAIVNNNTDNGNSIAALDDLIMANADILSGPGMIGRLKRQKAWKENNEKIDKMAIPEHYKQVFKELNPYGQYVDTFDKDGNIIESAAWKPTKEPVTTINKNEVFAKALAIIGKEKGGAERVTFLDANGKETPDIDKSVDKIWYAKKGTTYEALPKDKIIKAVNNAIANTPGAEESFRQDYFVAKYDLEKGIITPGITNDNGVMLSYDMYKDRLINDFADIAKYSHVVSNLDYNSAYQTATAKNLYNDKNSGNGAATDISVEKQINAGGIYQGQIASNVDSYAIAARNKKISNDVCAPILKAAGVKDVSAFIQKMKAMYPDANVTGPGTALNAYFANIPNQYTNADKAKFRDAMRDYTITNLRIQALTKGLSKSDVEKLNFNSSLSLGEFRQGNSKYDDAIIENINTILDRLDGKDAVFEIDDEHLKELTKLYKVNSINDIPFIKAVNNGNNYTITIANQDIPNNLPQFIYNLNNADDNTSGFWRGLKETVKNLFGADQYRYSTNIDFGTKSGQRLIDVGDYFTGNSNIFSEGYRNVLNPANKVKEQVTNPNGIYRLYDAYSNGLNQATKVQEKLTVKGSLTDLESTNYSDLTSIGIETDLANGRLTPSEAQNLKNRAEERIIGFFTSGAVTAGLLRQQVNGVYVEKDQDDLKTLLNAAYLYNPKLVSRKYGPLNGVDNPLGSTFTGAAGYFLDVYVDENLSKTTGFKKGQTVHILYSGLVDEGSDYDYGNTISVKSENALSNTKRSGLGSPIILNNYITGNTEIQYNPNGTYTCNFAGSSREVPEVVANRFAKSLFMLEQLNATLEQYDTQEVLNNPNVDETLNSIIWTIMQSTGASQAKVTNAVQNYLLYYEN